MDDGDFAIKLNVWQEIEGSKAWQQQACLAGQPCHDGEYDFE
jgi:hypothetical protein